MVMFPVSIQPGIVSLFSSTGSHPLALFSTHSDDSLSADSFICLLNDSTSLPPPESSKTLISSLPLKTDEDEGNYEGYRLTQTVLHMQSPTLRTTYICSPPINPASRDRGKRVGGLGLKHPWLHLQVRNMGREWSFEVGIVDKSGREGVVRCSTFQKEPKLKIINPPLLHLPLSFPSSSSRPLTSWSTIALHLPPLLTHFSSAALSRVDDEEDGTSDNETGEASRDQVKVPGGAYSHVSYVKVYATCRLRRMWFTDTGPGAGQNLPWEFQLFGSK